jgi:hypothetical protein
MKNLCLILIFVCSSCSTTLSTSGTTTNLQRTLAAENSPHKYFKGTDTIYMADGKSVIYSYNYFCERWADHSANQMHEIAVIIPAAGDASKYHVIMTIEDDGSSFSIANEEGTLSGGGKFIGTPWAWIGMYGKFVQQNGTYVDDANILSDNLITGIKKIYSSSGLLQGYDAAILNSTTADEFKLALQKVPSPMSKAP